MTAHAMVLLWAVVLGTGISGVASICTRWRRDHLPVVRHYRRFLFLVNVIVGGLLALTYVAVNLAVLKAAFASRLVASLFLVGSFWMVAALVCEFSLLVLAMTGRGLSGRVRQRAAMGLGAGPVVALAGLAVAYPSLVTAQILAVSEILNVALILGGIAVTVGLLGRRRPLARARSGRALSWFYGSHVAALALIAGAALLTYPWAWYALVVSFLIVNASPFVLFESLRVLDEAARAPSAERDGKLAAFAATYGVSERECDIVRLLLVGRRNQEIGDALCISGHTVKNHVYSVYRKAGVTNRVQLANLVRGR